MKKLFTLVLILMFVLTALPMTASAATGEMTRADYEKFGTIVTRVTSSDKLYTTGYIVRVGQDVNTNKVPCDVYDQIGGAILGTANGGYTLKEGNTYYFRAKVSSLLSATKFTDKGSLIIVSNGENIMTCPLQSEGSYKASGYVGTFVVPANVIIHKDGKEYVAGNSIKFVSGDTATVWYEGNDKPKDTSSSVKITCQKDLEKLGTIIKWEGTNGAQLKFSDDWTIQEGCVVHMDGKKLTVGTTVKKGSTATVWYEGSTTKQTSTTQAPAQPQVVHTVISNTPPAPIPTSTNNSHNPSTGAIDTIDAVQVVTFVPQGQTDLRRIGLIKSSSEASGTQVIATCNWLVPANCQVVRNGQTLSEGDLVSLGETVTVRVVA